MLGGGINDFGCIADNLVRWRGGGNVAQFVDIDGSAAAALKGRVSGNIFGDATPPGNPIAVADVIRIVGSANAVQVHNNRLNAIPNVTVTDFIDLSGCSQQPVSLDGNVALVDGGTITNTTNPMLGWTYDPPSIPNGASNSTAVTFAGAALGDLIEASFSLDLQGLTLTAGVSAVDSIKFTFSNNTGFAVNLGSGTLRARIKKPF